MIPLQTALEIVDAKIGDRRVPIVTIPVPTAAGRFLAADQRSRLDLPAFDKSAVDGYAILEGDVSEEYRLTGVVAAGEPDAGTLTPGTTVKVMTGAPVPPGTAKVVKVEETTELNGRVLLANPDGAANIRRKAEEIAAGDTILAAGTKLGLLHIVSLIGCGIAELAVAKQISLTIISTGDELVDSAAELTPGKIINTNGPLLEGLARKWGLAVVNRQSAPDDKSGLTMAVQRAVAESDMVVLTGGVSAGDYDFVPDAITEAGLEIHFSRVAVKPGLPTTFATGDNGIVFGLPGNPVAVYVMFHLFVLRAAARLSGSAYQPRQFNVRLAGDFSRRSVSRTVYSPCRILPSGVAEMVTYHGSGHLAALMHADGFLVIPQGVDRLPAGAEVSVVMFSERGD